MSRPDASASPAPAGPVPVPEQPAARPPHDAVQRSTRSSRTRRTAVVTVDPDPQRPAPRRRRGPRVPYALLVPSIGILVLALGYPLGWQVVTSLQKFGLAQQFGKPPEFVGLRNYLDLAADFYLWTVVARSIAFCLVNAGVTVLVGVLVALLMKAVGTDRVLFGSEKPGTGSQIDPETGRWFDDIHLLIDDIEWLDADRRADVLENNARSLFRL